MTLRLLTLTAGAPTLALRPVLQRLAAEPAPALPGLRARHWRAERRLVVGRYLYDSATLDVRGDPALAQLPPTETLPVELVPDVKLDRPVFVISAPRAGSTLVFETLQHAAALWTIDGESHGVIEGVPALHAAARGFESHRLDERDADPATVAAVRAGFVADARDRSGRRYLELPASARPDRIRLLEKTPENALRVAFLRAAFPDARFILLHRDPRQNVSSIVDAWRHDGFVRFPDLPGWSRRRWCFLLPPGWRALDGAPLSDIAAHQWRAAYEHALDDLAALPRNQWTSVECSELVAAPDRAFRRLCELIEIDVDPELAAVLARPLPLSSTTLTAPSPIKWRSNRDLLASSLVPLGPLAGRLRELGAIAVPAGAPPAPEPDPRIRFACHLDDAAPSPSTPAHVVHPALQLQRGASAPLAIVRRARYRDRFVDDHPIAWIEDPGTAVLQPVWIPRAHIQQVALLVPGREPPALPPSFAAQLAGAEILVDPARLAARRAYGDALVADAGLALARDRFCRLPALVARAQVAALARYYRALVDSGRWALGDAQVARRHGWHNELVARFYQVQLAGYVERIAGEPIKPTYSYSSAYQGGAALGAHADRKQCELTMSLVIDEQAGGEPWPLWFQAPDGQRSITLAPGDAVLFRGCELPHWREAAPPGQHSTTLLFHYVPTAFTGPLD